MRTRSRRIPKFSRKETGKGSIESDNGALSGGKNFAKSAEVILVFEYVYRRLSAREV